MRVLVDDYYEQGVYEVLFAKVFDDGLVFYCNDGRTTISAVAGTERRNEILNTLLINDFCDITDLSATVDTII